MLIHLQYNSFCCDRGSQAAPAEEPSPNDEAMIIEDDEEKDDAPFRFNTIENDGAGDAPVQ